VLVEDRDLERARSSTSAARRGGTGSRPPGRESRQQVPAGDRSRTPDEAAAEDDEEKELAPVSRPENTRTIEIERFLPPCQIDALYFEKRITSYRARKSGKNHSPSFATR